MGEKCTRMVNETHLLFKVWRSNLFHLYSVLKGESDMAVVTPNEIPFIQSFIKIGPLIYLRSSWRGQTRR